MKLSLLTRGQCFGDDCMVSAQPYKATLVSNTNDSSLYEISKDDFNRFFKQHSCAYEKMQQLSVLKTESEMQRRNNYSLIQSELDTIKQPSNVDLYTLWKNEESEDSLFMVDITRRAQFGNKSLH
jgi:CRP-like cAMP-binding protein